MKTIAFFTKGKVTTPEEQAEIDAINEEIKQKYQVKVLNSTQNASYGAGPLPADYANGTVPEEFKNLPKFELGE